jgi:dTDP-4-amino-4,6-dideoxygalactose transaminase
MGVHVWGQPCDVESLTEIADKHQLKLMFDASHAFGCSHQGKMIGNFGNAEVFSFHATKFINTFEGGAIVTNDDQLNQKLRLMKNFGFSDFDKVIYLGTNGKMSEVSAAMGLTSLENMEEFIEVNRRNYHYYQEGLANIPEISLFPVNESEKHNYQYIILDIDEKKTQVSRDLLIKILHAENVIARRYFYPGCHRMEPYRSYFPHAGLLLPETEKLAQRVLILPTGTAISEDDISKICQIIQIVVANEIKETNRDSE